MSETVLKVNQITKSFGGVKALKGVNLTIGKGEIHCLAGENGCGKSTLIKVISGVHAPDSGTVEIDGVVQKHLTPIQSMKAGVQVIYQDFSIFPNLTAAENIALNDEVAEKRKLVNWKQVKCIAQKAVEQIGVQLDLDAKVEDLSVADKQLIAISRALLQEAKLIIMDEPTTALTQKEVKALFKIIKGLQAKGISILFVSHKLDEVFEICEKITILRNGSNVVETEMNTLDHEKFVYYMTGKTLSHDYFVPTKLSPTPLLSIKDASQERGIQQINLDLFGGEILGITGLLGSGRTELANALFGLQPFDCGEVLIEGVPCRLRSVQDALKQKIGYVPEDRLTEGLFLEQSIGRNIVVGMVDRLVKKNRCLDAVQVKKEIESWIDRLKIVTKSESLPVKTLSGGNQQRVVLAKWLMMHPKILILNGPTVGVDIGSKAEIHEILRKLAEEGVGIIVISDDVMEVVENCSRILIMKKGRIVGEITEKENAEFRLVQMLA